MTTVVSSHLIERMNGVHGADGLFASIACEKRVTVKKRGRRGRRKKEAGIRRDQHSVATNMAEMIVNRAQETMTKQEKDKDENDRDAKARSQFSLYGGANQEEESIVQLSKNLVDLYEESKDLLDKNKHLIEELSALLHGPSSHDGDLHDESHHHESQIDGF